MPVLFTTFAGLTASDLRSLYTSSFRDSLSSLDNDNSMFEFLRLLPIQLSSMQRMLALEQRFFLPDHNLNYTDKMSMAEGVEVSPVPRY